MNADSRQLPAPATYDQKPVVAARIGLRWGVLFWVPILLLVLVLGVISYGASPANGKQFPTIVFLATLALSLPVLLFAGRWWATRGLSVSEWTFLLAAIAQGLALFLSFFFAIAVAMWFEGTNPFKSWSSSDSDGVFVAWGICCIWTLALGTVVVWRVRCAVTLSRDRYATNPATGKPVDASSDDNRHTQANGSRRFAIMLVSSLGIPVLLCLPVVLMLRYDASLYRNANTVLTSQIKAIDAQTADIKDLNKVKALLLARKQVVQSLETYVLRSADALGILSRLPSGVQLLSLEMAESRVALAVRVAEPAGELAVLQLLAQSGYRDLRIAARQRESNGVTGQVTIEASSTRGDGP